MTTTENDEVVGIEADESRRHADQHTHEEQGGPRMASSPPARRGIRYGNLWRGVPRELGFLLPTLPIVIASFVTLVTLFSTGVSTLVIVVGFFLLVATMWVARGFGAFEVLRLRAAGFPGIPTPEWRVVTGGGWFTRMFTVFRNGHYWLALLHGSVVNFVVGVTTWSITITWVASGLGGVTYWFYSRWIPQGDRGWSLYSVIVDFFVPGTSTGVDERLGDNIVLFVAGVIFLVTLPFITRGLVSIHYGIARGMLGPFRSDALRREVLELSASRGAAVAAEGHSLRRLERDIHDGPQQRLVRLQMDLAAAERQIDTDPARARQLIDEAMTQSREALDELRSLSRGFAPPILMDRGLVAALESAAVRSPVPTRIVSALPVGLRVPQEIERNAYFVASEALANAAKHAGARSVEVRVAVRPPVGAEAGAAAAVAGAVGGATPGGAGVPSWLDVTVMDDGRGGAAPLEGHGLAGLEQRLRGVGGSLELMSPVGGPTVLAAHLPFTVAAASASAAASSAGSAAEAASGSAQASTAVPGSASAAVSRSDRPADTGPGAYPADPLI
ncbi:sensor domain-containing protein [Herbiconiux sp. CPCC 205763]|uniref:histidine kinase n=1 Tax=Herbiconiux aconitum TaxID=2970913 RepID=A0ABT2GUT8_9MICO|nr:sensor domain-containing protein [Herbiconiux aconitum]MCS5719948.1 sensor domain-containing protein [Herbiconiux aconitum]